MLEKSSNAFLVLNVYTGADRDDRLVHFDGIWAPCKPTFDQLDYDYRKIGTDLDGDGTVVLTLNWWDTRSLGELLRPLSVLCSGEAVATAKKEHTLIGVHIATLPLDMHTPERCTVPTFHMPLHMCARLQVWQSWADGRAEGAS